MSKTLELSTVRRPDGSIVWHATLDDLHFATAQKTLVCGGGYLVTYADNVTFHGAPMARQVFVTHALAMAAIQQAAEIIYGATWKDVHGKVLDRVAS